MFKLISFRSDAAFWPFADRSNFDAVAQPRSVIRTVLSTPGRAVAALAKEVAARRAMQALSELDERMLRDIGIDRGQIPHATRQGRLRMQDLRADIARWS